MTSATIENGMVRDSPTVHNVGFRYITLRAHRKSDIKVPNTAFKIRNQASIPVGSQNTSIPVKFNIIMPAKNMKILTKPVKPYKTSVSKSAPFALRKTLYAA